MMHCVEDNLSTKKIIQEVFVC